MPSGKRKPAGSGRAVNITALPPPGKKSPEIGPRRSPEIAPLSTLEALFGYEGPGWGRGFAPVRPPFVARPFPPLRNRLLVCHDLAGGYGEDRFAQGGGYDRAYRMYDWGLVDIFVYFRFGCCFWFGFGSGSGSGLILVWFGLVWLGIGMVWVWLGLV